MRGFLAAVSLALLMVSGCAFDKTINRSSLVVATSLHLESDLTQAVASADAATKKGFEQQAEAGAITVKQALDANAKWEAFVAKFKTALHTWKDASVTLSHGIDVVWSAHDLKAFDLNAAIAGVAQAWTALLATLNDLNVHIKGVN